MSKSKIEWTGSTWNPITGCNKISPGCKNCYAERMSNRLRAMRNPNYLNGFSLTLHPHVLEYPLKLKKPSMIFVNSMSDLFHEKVPFQYIKEVFSIMKQANWHTFQILTKRSERLLKLKIDWPENIWMGVSVENNNYKFRIDHLRITSAKTKFLSLEPLLGSLDDLDLRNIDWIIVGGESGPYSRKMEYKWVSDIKDQCDKCGIPFFFKQWGGKNKKKSGRILDNRTWDDLPLSYNSSNTYQATLGM